MIHGQVHAVFAHCGSLADDGFPHILHDGEVQVDVAVIPTISRIQIPESPIRGRANVLIFPNLDAGNISYKIAQIINITAEKVWIYLQDIPATQMIEFGRFLPAPGEEVEWEKGMSSEERASLPK